MKSKRSINTIIAVTFALALLLSRGAQASSLLGFDQGPASRPAAERSAGVFDQVSAWLIGAWNHLTGAFAEETTTPPPTTNSTCDAGWGLDPEGCPKG